MSASLLRPSGAEEIAALPDGLDASQATPEQPTSQPPPQQQQSQPASTLALSALPVGARLILRCRKDWRDATIVAIALEQVTLSVSTAKGRTYRVRRPASSEVFRDGSILVLGEGSWRAGIVRYDARW